MIECFDKKFRITRDEQGDLLIRCRNGFVYEIGPARLGVWLTTGRPLASFDAIHRRWPTTAVEQLGDGEVVFSYPMENDKAAIQFLRSLGSHRKRRLSEEQRSALIERGRQFHFQPGRGAGSALQAPESARAGKP